MPKSKKRLILFNAKLKTNHICKANILTVQITKKPLHWGISTNTWENENHKFQDALISHISSPLGPNHSKRHNTSLILTQTSVGDLKASDFCGEELFAWVMNPRSSTNLPISTRTVIAQTEVEAFAPRATNLKFVASQFWGLHSKKFQHIFRQVFKLSLSTFWMIIVNILQTKWG